MIKFNRKALLGIAQVVALLAAAYKRKTLSD